MKPTQVGTRDSSAAFPNKQEREKGREGERGKASTADVLGTRPAEAGTPYNGTPYNGTPYKR
jgi:hypothetical protein